MRKINDLTGRRFGKLVVTGRSPAKGRDVRWECRCDCGGTFTALGRSLNAGKRTHCGCVARKAARTRDLAGQKFRMLTALYPTDKRDPQNGTVVWHCRCDCGNETDISCENLLYSSVVSCSCRKAIAGQTLRKRLTHVAGTSLEALRTTKIRRDSGTGYTGVYRKRNGYCAEIMFQKRRYALGHYKRLEDAVRARQEARHELHERFISHYEQWKLMADADPWWGEQNPIEVSVTRDSKGRLHAHLKPDMAQEAGRAAADSMAVHWIEGSN